MTDPAGLRPRSERCPDSQCTDEDQCWRCDYEESQAARAIHAPLRACRGSLSGRCLAVTHGDPGCATADGECVHAPAADAAPAPADVREQIAEALMGWAERNNAPQYAAMRRPDTVRQNAYSRAAAVLQAPAIAAALEALHQINDMQVALTAERERAEQAEAALERVEAVLHDLPYEHAKKVLAALEQGEQMS